MTNDAPVKSSVISLVDVFQRPDLLFQHNLSDALCNTTYSGTSDIQRTVIISLLRV